MVLFLTQRAKTSSGCTGFQVCLLIVSSAPCVIAFTLPVNGQLISKQGIILSAGIFSYFILAHGGSGPLLGDTRVLRAVSAPCVMRGCTT